LIYSHTSRLNSRHVPGNNAPNEIWFGLCAGTPAPTGTASSIPRKIWDGFLTRGGAVYTAMLQKASLTVIVPGEELSPFFSPDGDSGRNLLLPSTQLFKCFKYLDKYQKRESEAAKILTPQLASSLAARLGGRGGRHCHQLSPDLSEGFPRALPLATSTHSLSPLQSNGGGTGGTHIHHHYTLEGESVAPP